MDLCSNFSSQIAKSQPWAGGIAGPCWREILWALSFHSWRASEGIVQTSALKKALASPYTANLGASWTSWGILIQTRLSVSRALPFASQPYLSKVAWACCPCQLAILEVSLRSGKDLVAIPHCLRTGSYWRTSSILQASAFGGHPAWLGTERRWTQTSWSYYQSSES